MTAEAQPTAAESLLDQWMDLPPQEAADLAIALPGTPTETAKRLFDLANAAYWKRKNLPAAIAFSRAGIRHALDHAGAAADRDAADQLRGQAKALAFNLASFTWTGWDEPGITISEADQQTGRDAAALNLQLALDLNRPAGPVANAHWLVGAHALAAGDHDAALQSFAAYRSIAPTDDHRHLADGYAAIAILGAGRDGSDGTVRFDAAVVALRGFNTDDAIFFADQLLSVRKFFAKGCD